MSLRRDVAAFIQEYMMYIPPSGRYGGRGYSTKKELHEGTLVRVFGNFLFRFSLNMRPWVRRRRRFNGLTNICTTSSGPCSQGRSFARGTVVQQDRAVNRGCDLHLTFNSVPFY